MKTLITLIAIACSVTLALAETAAEKAEAWYQQGLIAEKAGDPTTAMAAYKAALALNTNHANARYRAGEVKINASALKANAIEAKIGGVMIPAYQIEEVTVQEALQILANAISKETKDQIVPNFIIEDPNKKLADTKVTLNIKNVPVSAILKYILAQSNTKVRYDEHAVVVMAR
jgi:tetratricopeptide (TPR) repeat protein